MLFAAVRTIAANRCFHGSPVFDSFYGDASAIRAGFCRVEPFYADVAANLLSFRDFYFQIKFSRKPSSQYSSLKANLSSNPVFRTQGFSKQMDPAFQAKLDRQQSSMLEKLSSIIDNKLDSMKRQLEEASNTQMSELKKIRLTEPSTLQKKGHEQQFKHNQQVKSVVSEAKDAVNSVKQDACIAKLNEGIELIDRRHAKAHSNSRQI